MQETFQSRTEQTENLTPKQKPPFFLFSRPRIHTQPQRRPNTPPNQGSTRNHPARRTKKLPTTKHTTQNQQDTRKPPSNDTSKSIRSVRLLAVSQPCGAPSRRLTSSQYNLKAKSPYYQLRKLTAQQGIR